MSQKKGTKLEMSIESLTEITLSVQNEPRKENTIMFINRIIMRINIILHEWIMIRNNISGAKWVYDRKQNYYFQLNQNASQHYIP